MYSLDVLLQINTFLNQADLGWSPQQNEPSKYRNGSSSVSFTDIEFKYCVIIDESRSQQVLQILQNVGILHATAPNVIFTVA